MKHKHAENTTMKYAAMLKTVAGASFTIAPALALAACFLMPKACTRPETARQVLEQQGYSNIEITGWRPLMAGRDDAVSTGFEATAPNGQRVSGAVTGGLIFKGSTVRFD